MAYDEDLTIRFREALGTQENIEEKRMMGGVCFMVNGNMVGGADRQKDGRGRFMFRVGKDNYADALKRPGASAMDMGGRRMRGFLFVQAEGCDDKMLKEWTELALSFNATLPEK